MRLLLPVSLLFLFLATSQGGAQLTSTLPTVYFTSLHGDEVKSCTALDLWPDEAEMCALILYSPGSQTIDGVCLDCVNDQSMKQPDPDPCASGKASYCARRIEPSGNRGGVLECTVAHTNGPHSVCTHTIERSVTASSIWIKFNERTDGSVHAYVYGGDKGHYAVIRNGEYPNYGEGLCKGFVDGDPEGVGIYGSMSIDRRDDGTYHCGYNTGTGYHGAGMYFRYS